MLLGAPAWERADLAADSGRDPQCQRVDLHRRHLPGVGQVERLPMRGCRQVRPVRVPASAIECSACRQSGSRRLGWRLLAHPSSALLHTLLEQLVILHGPRAGCGKPIVEFVIEGCRNHVRAARSEQRVSMEWAAEFVATFQAPGQRWSLTASRRHPAGPTKMRKRVPRRPTRSTHPRDPYGALLTSH